MNDENNVNIDIKQKGLENFILLVLGMVDRPMSMLHLEKEVFLLWNFDKQIQPFLRFIKHFRGPFSKEIQETIFDPVYLDEHWEYIPPKKTDNISGGCVVVTDIGNEEYARLFSKMAEREEFVHLLAGIKMVRELYDKLTLKELLLLIYDTYPEFVQNSDISEDINQQKPLLIKSLMRKGFLDEERYISLIN